MTPPGRLRGLLDCFPDHRVLVLGDVILDRYWWGDASRLSPEAPVPVVRRLRATTRPGGAGNTAANLAAMGAQAELFAVAGNDRECGELESALADAGVRPFLVRDQSRPTTSKTRVVATHQQIVRVDDEVTEPVSEATAQALAAQLGERLRGAAALVVSDYAKGAVTPALLGTAIAAARESGVPVLVDPKGAGAGRYAGASLLKPNRVELGVLTRMPVRNHDETLAAGARLSSEMPGTLLLVTEGADGLTLFEAGRAVEQVRSAPRQVFDVTGAGDTVLAAVTLARAAGATWREAMELAAEAAGIAIGLLGTAAVTLQQLRAAITARGAEHI